MTGHQIEQDYIDLAIEYGMIESTSDFRSRPQKHQNKILAQISIIAQHNAAKSEGE